MIFFARQVKTRHQLNRGVNEVRIFADAYSGWSMEEEEHPRKGSKQKKKNLLNLCVDFFFGSCLLGNCFFSRTT